MADKLQSLTYFTSHFLVSTDINEVHQKSAGQGAGEAK